jgi:hypothetical protein
MLKLRRFYTPARLAEIYDHKYDHTTWSEHVARVHHTIDITQQLIDEHHLTSVTDLSCGDGVIVGGLNIENKTMNDITLLGDGIEVTVKTMKDVDLFICTETIEHLEAPWTVIEEIAQRAKWLVLSCPNDESPDIHNHEHYWSFTAQDVGDMLAEAGFVDLQWETITQPRWTYEYQIWTGRSVHA